MIARFREHLRLQNKSIKTLKSYVLKVDEFLKWYEQTFGFQFERLYRENFLDYLAFIRNIKGNNAKTVNCKIAALKAFNDFLVETGMQPEMVINKRDRIRIQSAFVNPSNVTKEDVEQLRQIILQKAGVQKFAIVTLMLCCGIRISECLNIKMSHFNLTTKELVIHAGKGDKTRIVYLNQKSENALREYIRVRKSDSEYLFANSKGGKFDPSTINKIFNKYSQTITPHGLRHFCATSLVNSGNFAIHEVASLLGHTNIHTTQQYLHTSKDKLIEKLNGI